MIIVFQNLHLELNVSIRPFLFIHNIDFFAIYNVNNYIVFYLKYRVHCKILHTG